MLKTRAPAWAYSYTDRDGAAGGGAGPGEPVLSRRRRRLRVDGPEAPHPALEVQHRREEIAPAEVGPQDLGETSSL